MERISIGFYVPLLIHHGTANIVVGYNHLTSTSNNTQLKLVAQFGFRYLTIWNMILQTCYLSTVVICYVLARIDYKQCKSYAKKLEIILKFVNVSIVSPISIYIVLLFWSVFTANRELIYPIIIEDIVPAWGNYSMHAVIIILPLIEVFLQRSIRMPIFKHSILALTLFLTIYGTTLLCTFYFNEIWLYPFLKFMPWASRIYMIFVSYIVCVSLLTLTSFVHKSVFSRNKFRD
ncbi:androgen-dependent TFPI-regulating protein-like [Onthophagus taurus]|uniref:androgen-dependent TFPI-regulating protein-like n=1 Tax=Onthophagus taurus TaxID=166361 RepID=UPI000C206C77|nr:androgen-dependent TFPI-regulating protein-like [Onthophagus taurus]